ncbi:MAG: ABC transporter ATP-binding protein NatA [Fimbriimonadaceae bacterium]|nr:ABC transporter ATP-binding protein NatA [Fimbriimonadaceae bacterium]
MVKTEGISKSFKDPKKGGFLAVDNVSIEAQPGKIFGLLGVNGAGKTTLLRILSTVLRPDHGTATVAGFDIARQPDRVRAHIGFLSTSTALYGRLTPQELLAYFGGLYGLKGAELQDRIQFAVEKLNIGEFAERLCDKLSTGQKQRVSIARTILHDPPVLFFDEPTAGLDVVTSQTIMEFIEESRSRGKTVVFSTHIMSEAQRLCDHIAIIHAGKILGEGSVDELLASTGQQDLERAFLALVGYRREAA